MISWISMISDSKWLGMIHIAILPYCHFYLYSYSEKAKRTFSPHSINNNDTGNVPTQFRPILARSAVLKTNKFKYQNNLYLILARSAVFQ